MNILEQWLDKHRVAAIAVVCAATLLCAAVVITAVESMFAETDLSSAEFEQTHPIDGLLSLYHGVDHGTLATVDLGNFTEALKTDVYQRGYDGKWFRVDNLYLIDFGTAAPTSGTWGRGCIVFNSEPSAGGTVGWVCVTAGTPGTWKAFGTIAS